MGYLTSFIHVQGVIENRRFACNGSGILKRIRDDIGRGWIVIEDRVVGVYGAGEAGTKINYESMFPKFLLLYKLLLRSETEQVGIFLCNV